MSVDSQGRKLTGKLTLDEDDNLNGIKWSHKDASKKWTGEYDGSGVTIMQTLATDGADLESYYYGVLPEDANVYVKPKGTSNAYRISDHDSFSWVDSIAKRTCNEIEGRGGNGQTGLNKESAYHAQCGMVMFRAESIRCLQNHFTNMMSLQLIEQGYMSVNLLFNTYPMARGGTWQVKDSQGKRKTGLKLLESDKQAYNSLSQGNKKIFEGDFTKDFSY